VAQRKQGRRLEINKRRPLGKKKHKKSRRVEVTPHGDGGDDTGTICSAQLIELDDIHEKLKGVRLKDMPCRHLVGVTEVGKYPMVAYTREKKRTWVKRWETGSTPQRTIKSVHQGPRGLTLFERTAGGRHVMVLGSPGRTPKEHWEKRTDQQKQPPRIWHAPNRKSKIWFQTGKQRREKLDKRLP